MGTDKRQDLVDTVDWWHSIEVAPGVVTPGGWDLRPTAQRMPWPDLAGKRCLDIGTMDGFWAFELERRGAREVVAVDLLDGSRHDLPYTRRRPGPGPTLTERKRAFEVAAELIGSAVKYRDLSVYDLDAKQLGQFDVVVMGYVLQMLRDPLRALEAVREVCTGHLLLLDTVSVPLSLLPAPLARLNARRGALEWFVFNRRGLCQAVEMAGFEVDVVTPIIRDHPGAKVSIKEMSLKDRVSHKAGVLGRSIVVRAIPLSGS